GPTLESYLASKGPLSEAQARKVFPDTVAGLAEAHKAGIVHRDIKPSNLIFRRSDRRLGVVDFGLAGGGEEVGQTKVGGVSILFAAPEQHYGESATQASDVFSLCAVIHYALNYDKPEQRKPNRFAPGLIPESLRAAVTQGMKHNADERFRDAGRLLAALAAGADSGPGVHQDYEAYLAFWKPGNDTKHWLEKHLDRVEHWHKAAEQGDAKAMLLYGDCHEQGIGVSQDYGEALGWFRKAADQGLAHAQASIGWLYQNGLGVRQDYGEALGWFRKAADQGLADAQYNIGT